MHTASDIEQFDAPKPRTFQVFGHTNGLPWGTNLTIEADTIEEAHEEGEARLDVVISVKEVSL